jgi:hypothetical protein
MNAPTGRTLRERGWHRTGFLLVRPSATLPACHHFQPHAEPRTCRYCHFLVQLEPETGSAICGHRETRMRHAQAHHGCAFWQREPDADDD